MEHEYNTVEEALEDLKQGRIVLVTDDENRENEGDMICAAEFATQENINFMASYAKGLICTPMSVELAGKLGFVPMVTKNTDNHETAFTVSIDYKNTSGIRDLEQAAEHIAANALYQIEVDHLTGVTFNAEMVRGLLS